MDPSTNPQVYDPSLIPPALATGNTCRRACRGPKFGQAADRSALVGFTLIELLVVVAIIAILAGLALSTLGYVNKKGADSRARSEVAALSAAIESYKLDTGAYPPTAASLYTNLCPSAAGARVYFEPTPQMISTNGSVVQFTDPWGNAYNYSNYTSYFELWSTAGGTGTANSNNWIRN